MSDLVDQHVRHNVRHAGGLDHALRAVAENHNLDAFIRQSISETAGTLPIVWIRAHTGRTVTCFTPIGPDACRGKYLRSDRPGQREQLDVGAAFHVDARGPFHADCNCPLRLGSVFRSVRACKPPADAPIATTDSVVHGGSNVVMTPLTIQRTTLFPRPRRRCCCVNGDAGGVVQLCAGDFVAWAAATCGGSGIIASPARRGDDLGGCDESCRSRHTGVHARRGDSRQKVIAKRRLAIVTLHFPRKVKSLLPASLEAGNRKHAAARGSGIHRTRVAGVDHHGVDGQRAQTRVHRNPVGSAIRAPEYAAPGPCV